MKKNIYVYMNIDEIDYFVGTLTYFYSKDNEYSQFIYSDQWLNNKYVHPLGFDLPLSKIVYDSRMQSQDACKEHFYAFLNANIFSWSSIYNYTYLLLYLKRMNILPKVINDSIDINTIYTVIQSLDKFKKLDGYFIPSVNLLELYNDLTRTGALRFKLDKSSEFIKKYDKSLIPSVEKIDDLIDIMHKIKKHKETIKELEQYVACSSSLSGFMPKLSVYNEKKELCIAKFGSLDDDFMYFGEEYLALKIAQKFGIKIQDYELKYTKDKQPYILIKRFDRDGEKRYPVMEWDRLIYHRKLQKKIINPLRKLCYKRPITNMREYYKRLIFRYVTFTTKDARGNIAFIFDSKKGWNLSPAYDVTFKSYYDVVDLTYIDTIYKKNVRRTRKKLKKIKKLAYLYKVNKKQLNTMLLNLHRASIGWKNLAYKIGYDENSIKKVKFYPEAFRCPKIR